VRSLVAGRPRAVVGLCSLALTLALAAGATPAGAVVAKIGGHGYGITPIPGVNPASIAGTHWTPGPAVSRARRAGNRDELPGGGGQLLYFGGPVMPSNNTHVIYWDPNKEFKPTTTGIIGSFFSNVAHDSGLPSNVFAVDAQYTDPTGHAAYNSTFAGSLVDEDAYPVSGCAVPAEGDQGPPYTRCLMDQQLQTELTNFITAKALPRGPTQLYFLLLPHKVVTCFPEEECSNNVFCAYHSYIEPGKANEIIYADIPFSLVDGEKEAFSIKDAKGCQFDGNASIQQPNPDNEGGKDEETRFADVALKFISHEYSEAITDPLVGEETAWVDNSALHQENGDKCNATPSKAGETGLGIDAKAFLPTLGGTALGENLFNQSINTGSYYLQSEWDNAARACQMKPLELSGAAFAPPSPTAGSPVGFSGTATDLYGALELAWTFGDGATATGASPSHTYAAAGEYTVTMTPKDALTDATGPSTNHTVTVSLPPPPPVTQTVAVATTPPVVAARVVPPSSAFTTGAGSFNAKTGAITLKETVVDPGKFSVLATFANGKFGAFASASKCKTGFIRLAGKCGPAKIVFARSSVSVAGAGTVTLTLKPGSSAAKALKNALKSGKALLVSGTLSFQSSRGGSPVSHPFAIVVKLKK
jgi:hypothetical protein